ncbi:MAG: hypothetical protein H0T52_15865 [Lautropia sp.]|nr:hypothetical protein [Lautropia sp.]
MRNSPMSCVLCLLMVSCGGGGGGGGGAAITSVSGTAAQGAPLANAGVEVKCRAGSGSGTTDAAGKFSVNLAGAQGPCLLKAKGQGLELVSLLPGNSGIANVTPLTHLLAARLLGSAPASAFAGAGEAQFVLVTDQGVSAAQGQVSGQILRLGAEMPAVNWATQSFTATAGDAMDGALELLKRRLDEQNKTLDGAAGELALGDLQNLKPPTGQSPTCVPGIIAGFNGPVQDALRRVVSGNPTGGGDSPGGIGDGAGDGAAGGVGVGGSLGQLINVDVTAQFASGTTFGPVRVDADTANGMVTIVPCDLPPPVLVTVAGAIQPGSANPALSAKNQFVEDLVDGVLDLRTRGTAVVAGAGGATYNYDTFAARLTTETGATAKALGAGALKTRSTPVQRLRAKGGTSFAAPADWVFTLTSDGTLQVTAPAGQQGTVPQQPANARFARIDVFDRSTRTPSQFTNDPWQNCLVATSADGRSLLTWQVGVAAQGFVDMANVDFDAVPTIPAKRYTVGSPTDPVVTVAPESLSLSTGSGGDSIVFVLRSGTLGAVGGCDVHDQHPGLASGFGSRAVVQVQQDFGNRYVVYSDGTVEGWGRKKNALGIADRNAGVLEGSERRAVVAQTGSGALNGVAMLTRGERIHETRALIRSADPAADGKVAIWGDGLPVPRQIPGLEKICWIAGPYSVGCNGQLFYATVTAVQGENPVLAVTQVAGVPLIWRVSAGHPVLRDPPGDPNVSGFELTNLKLSYTAIAQDGSVYRLAEGVASLE